MPCSAWGWCWPDKKKLNICICNYPNPAKHQIYIGTILYSSHIRIEYMQWTHNKMNKLMYVWIYKCINKWWHKWIYIYIYIHNIYLSYIYGKLYKVLPTLSYQLEVPTYFVGKNMNIYSTSTNLFICLICFHIL